MNLVPKLASITAKMRKFRDDATDNSAKLAYDDALYLINPFLELVAKDQKERDDDLVELAAAIAKYMKKFGVEAI